MLYCYRVVLMKLFLLPTCQAAGCMICNVFIGWYLTLRQHTGICLLVNILTHPCFKTVDLFTAHV